ncbi:MAG: hypothetical protein ACU0CI_00305 [Shimia sp.]
MNGPTMLAGSLTYGRVGFDTGAAGGDDEQLRLGMAVDLPVNDMSAVSIRYNGRARHV